VQLCEYYGIGERLIITSPKMTTAVGVPRDILNCIYNSFDVQVSTTLGEGWGLTQMEGMACKIPQIVPRWSALAEWANGGVRYVECTSEAASMNGLNTIGGIADRHEFIAALEELYLDPHSRKSIGEAGYAIVTKPEFQWSSVAQQFDAIIKQTMGMR
jgi:D-inositol-3-phosphate glycosyltransferase